MACGGEQRTFDQIQTALEAILEGVLSSRRTIREPAREIAALTRVQQNFTLHWTGVVARTNPELAFQFASTASEALRRFDLATAQAWIVEAMDVYDRDGLHSGSEIFRRPEAFERGVHDRKAAVELSQVRNVLELFVRALSGRALRIESAMHAYTDIETIYLPPRIAQRNTTAENFLIYKASAALLWAQTRYGTFSVDLQAACSTFPDPGRALALLNALETVRLEACISRVLPGLAREMKAMRGRATDDARCERLLGSSASIHDSVALLAAVYDDPPRFGRPYTTTLRPELALTNREARIARDQRKLQTMLAELIENENVQTGPESPKMCIEARDSRADGASSYVLKVDGIAVRAPPGMCEVIDSIVQDLGEIPEAYLIPASEEGSQNSHGGQKRSAEGGHLRGDVSYTYDEWDHARGHYRKNWCTLRELDVLPGDPEFVQATLGRYSGEIARLRRIFEFMRGEERILKRQTDGDDIDFDAVVEACIDVRTGVEMSSLLFAKRQKIERDLAVMFMVDMSGSTKGWVNEAEREALIMLCEALEALGDRYAIYGFSGMTRKRCEVFRVKDFDEPYGRAIRERISGIEPQDYTRMGAAIRHLTQRLNEIEARTRILIALSDGKPDDYSDNYRGEYGIEDTRQALIEAHRSGIRPFCITIDHEGRDYLPHMYGPVNWTLVNDVKRLPLKVAEIYRRLTY